MLLDEVGTYLDTQVTSLTLGTNLKLGRMPHSPDTAVALYEPVSAPPVFAIGSAQPILERPRLQVHVRHASSYSSGRELAQEVWQAINAVVNQTLSGTYYLALMALDSPTFLMRDDNDRVLFTMNFEVEKEVSVP